MRRSLDEEYSDATTVWDAILHAAPNGLVTQYLALRDGDIETQDPLKTSQLVLAMQSELCRCAIDMFSQGDISAIGFSEHPDHPDAKPEWIPPSNWTTGHFDWDKNELSGKDVVFRKIKAVVEPSAKVNWSSRSFHCAESFLLDGGVRFAIVNVVIGDLLPGSQTVQRNSKRGPIPVRGHIATTYDRLKKEGKIKFAESLSANLPAIKNRLREDFGRSQNLKMRGESPETIRRAISAEFKKDKDLFKARRRTKKES